MNPIRLNRWSSAATAASVCVVLAACGGGSVPATTVPVSTAVNGTAAVGAPIVGGAVALKCAAGTVPAVPLTTPSGGWGVTLTDVTFPCMVQLTGGTINGVANTTSYQSVATSPGVVNITPITDLIVANLFGSATPAARFNTLTTSELATITAARVTTALGNVRTALPQLTPLATINPLTVAFNPAAGVPADDMLSALRTALGSANVTYANLLTAAAAAIFTAPNGLPAALTTAVATASGGVTTATTTTTTTTPAPTPSTAMPALNTAKCEPGPGITVSGTTLVSFQRCGTGTVADFASSTVVDSAPSANCKVSIAGDVFSLTKISTGEVISARMNGEPTNKIEIYTGTPQNTQTTLTAQNDLRSADGFSSIGFNSVIVTFNAAGVLRSAGAIANKNAVTSSFTCVNSAGI